MENKTKIEIINWIRTGFYSKDELIEFFCKEFYEPGELDEEEVKKVISNEIKILKAEQNSWPKITDVDRLKQVFNLLNEKGIISLHNAGYTQSDGYEDVIEKFEENKEKMIFIGYCYYQGQDLEHAVQGQGLHLAFGPIDPKKEETDGPKIGKIIVNYLEKHDFEIEWNGTFSKRIFIKNIDWKNKIRILDDLNDYVIEPYNVDAWNDLVIDNFNEEEFGRAVEGYEQIIEIDPNNADVWGNLGLLYYDKKEYDKAIECYLKTIEINPSNAGAWYYLGSSYCDKGEHDEAIEYYQKAIELNPLFTDFADVWYNKACVESLRHNFKKSLKFLKRAIELDEECKIDAKSDSTFNNLKTLKKFKKLIK